jgi:hypothetical protein
MKLFTRAAPITLLIGAATSIHAQELVPDTKTTMKAEVLEVLSQERREVPGTDTKTDFQTLKVRVLEGDEKGKEIEVENDYLNLQPGEVFYLTHTVNSLDDMEYYTVSDPYRLPILFGVFGLFVLCGGVWREAGGSWFSFSYSEFLSYFLRSYSRNFSRLLTDSHQYWSLLNHCSFRVIHNSWFQQNHFNCCHWDDSNHHHDGFIVVRGG